MIGLTLKPTGRVYNGFLEAVPTSNFSIIHQAPYIAIRSHNAPIGPLGWRCHSTCCQKQPSHALIVLTVPSASKHSTGTGAVGSDIYRLSNVFHSIRGSNPSIYEIDGHSATQQYRFEARSPAVPISIYIGILTTIRGDQGGWGDYHRAFGGPLICPGLLKPYRTFPHSGAWRWTTTQ